MTVCMLAPGQLIKKSIFVCVKIFALNLQHSNFQQRWNGKIVPMTHSAQSLNLHLNSSYPILYPISITYKPIALGYLFSYLPHLVPNISYLELNLSQLFTYITQLWTYLNYYLTLTLTPSPLPITIFILPIYNLTFLTHNSTSLT